MAPRALALQLKERLERSRRCRRGRGRGAGLPQSAARRLASGTRGWPRCCAPARPMATRRWAAAEPVNVEYVSANPTGPMHVGPRARRRGRRCARIAPGQGRLRGVPRILHQRCRRAGRCARALAPLALSRNAGRGGGRDAGGALSRRLSQGDRARRSSHATASVGAMRPRRIGCPCCATSPLPTMMELIRTDLAVLGVRHDVFTSERAIVASGAIERALETLGERGLVYVGTLDPPKGLLPDDWEPHAADALPRQPVRRRCRPAAQEVGRVVDLFRRRHRLSSRQVPPRLCRHDRRVGRRSRRPRQAHGRRRYARSPTARARST